MRNSQQQALRQLKTLISSAVRFRFVITFVLAGILLAFVVQSISNFAATEANQDRYNEGLSSIKRTKFDQAAVDKIQSLKDNGVDVQAELPSDRVNPF
jgi:hypothetical protein